MVLRALLLLYADSFMQISFLLPGLWLNGLKITQILFTMPKELFSFKLQIIEVVKNMHGITKVIKHHLCKRKSAPNIVILLCQVSKNRIIIHLFLGCGCQWQDQYLLPIHKCLRNRASERYGIVRQKKTFILPEHATYFEANEASMKVNEVWC